MMIDFNGRKMFYDKQGSGPCLVFLHGYLESKEVWKSFSSFFQEYTVIMPDLPGQGDSEMIDENQTVEQMAEAVKAVIENEGFSSCFIYGHSMGGYVALAFERKYPEMVKSLGLIHSTIYPDNEEKKKNRIREIELIRAGKKVMVVSGMLPNVVAKENIQRLKPQIDEIVERAKMFPAKGIIAVLNAMMQRPKHKVNAETPFHLIAGDKDNFIPNEVYSGMKSANSGIVLDFIFNTGHASFIENPAKTAQVIKFFLNSVN